MVAPKLAGTRLYRRIQAQIHRWSIAPRPEPVTLPIMLGMMFGFFGTLSLFF